MGRLVESAQKVEEGIEFLRTNWHEATQQTMANAQPRLRAKWKQARKSLQGKGGRLRPVGRRVETLRDQLSHRTAVTFDRAEAPARTTLKRIIENTIDELEKMKRSLERDSDRIWHAA